MRVAQALYEDGLITYMRTDGVEMAPEAISAARKAIANRYDAGLRAGQAAPYTSKAKNAQEAHEAIRPTDFDATAPARAIMRRLYELICKRALASQMASARLERTTVELTDGTGSARSAPPARSCSSPASSRFTKRAATTCRGRGERAACRALREGDAPAEERGRGEQHFTQPPPRYSEASLVKRMEELGIGRPSTYASILQTLKDREYVRSRRAASFPRRAAGW